MPKAPLDWLARSRLTARHLALIVQLDDKGSVLRAAEAAHMSQPAASRLLHTIETTLGVPLFERHPRGVVATPYGEVLVRHARAALAEFRQAQDEVAALASGIAGDIRIGTAVTSATDLVPLAVTALNSRHPGIRVTIELGFSEQLVDDLIAHKLDIAIARLHPSHDLRGLAFAPLGEEPHGLMVRRGHPLCRRRSIELRDLAAQTWVLPPSGNVMRDRLTVLFLQRGVELPQNVVETSALPVIASLLRASDMVAPLPIEVVRADLDSGRFVQLPIRLDLRLGAAGIVTLSNHPLSPAARAMLGELHSVANRLYPRGHDEARHAARPVRATRRRRSREA